MVVKYAELCTIRGDIIMEYRPGRFLLESENLSDSAVYIYCFLFLPSFQTAAPLLQAKWTNPNLLDLVILHCITFVYEYDLFEQ